MRLAPAKSTGRGTSPQHHPDQRADDRELGGEPGAAAGVAQHRRQMSGPGHQLDVDVGRQLVERGQAGGGGDRVARQRAGVEHRAERRQRLHQLAPAADGADREPATDHLAERRQVGQDVVLRLRAAGPEAEAGDHLVEHEHRADPVALGAQALEEPGLRARPRPCWRRPVRRARAATSRRARAPRCTGRRASRRPHLPARRRCPAARAWPRRCHRPRAARRSRRGSCRGRSRPGRGPCSRGRGGRRCSWPRCPSS